MDFKFADQNLRKAVEDAEQWKKTEWPHYGARMCAKRQNPACRAKQARYHTLGLFNPTPKDIQFYEDFDQHHGGLLCILPKNHSGKCIHGLDTFFPGDSKISKGIRLKLQDPKNNVGSNGIVFMNRGGRRNFPISFGSETKDHISEQIKTRNLEFGPDKPYKGFAIRTKHAATNTGIASSIWDIASLILGIKNISTTISDSLKRVLDEHREEYLVPYWKQFNIRIVKNNQTCSPLENDLLELDWFAEDSSDTYRIEFGHGQNISDKFFGTRGGNTILIPRHENLTINFSSLKERSFQEKINRIHQNFSGHE